MRMVSARQFPGRSTKLCVIADLLATIVHIRAIGLTGYLARLWLGLDLADLNGA